MLRHHLMDLNSSPVTASLLASSSAPISRRHSFVKSVVLLYEGLNIPVANGLTRCALGVSADPEAFDMTMPFAPVALVTDYSAQNSLNW